MKKGLWPFLMTSMVCAGLCTVADPLFAQDFYVDTGYFGDPLPPSSDFSAAAEEPGTWNRVAEAPAVLVDVHGAATSVTLTSSTTTFNGVHDNADTVGDVGRLMDDNGGTSSGIGESTTLTVSGLRRGQYDVYTYAWRSIFTTNSTASVDVNGVGAQIVQPVLSTFTGFSEGETHSVHRVTIGGDEDLSIVVTALDDGFDQAFFAGFQITQRIFSDGFEPGDTSEWTADVP